MTAMDGGIKFCKLKRTAPLARKGFSIIESLILIVILSLTIAGILEVSAYTTRMQLAARQGIDSQLAAASWFAALESFPPAAIRDTPNTAFASADEIIGSAAADYIRNRSVAPEANGAIVVSVQVRMSQGNNQLVSKTYNAYGNDTVSDDKVKP